MAGIPKLIETKTTICYEEIVTLGDLVNLNSSFGLKMEVKLGNGAYTTLLSYTGYAFPALTSVINLKNNPDLANVAFGSANTITIRISGSYSTDVGANYDEIKTYTFSRGYDPTFNLKAETKLIYPDGYPHKETLNLISLAPGYNAGSKFTSATSTLEINGWNFHTINKNKDKWTPNENTIYFHPAKYNGCGVDSVGIITKLIVEFEFETDPYLCRNGSKINLLDLVKKPLPATLPDVEYSGSFVCLQGPSTITGNYFDPSLVESNINRVRIDYYYYQKDVKTKEIIRSSTDVFFIYIKDTPVAPADINVDSVYCVGNNIEIKLSNLAGNDLYWIKNNDTIHNVHPYIVKNIMEPFEITAAYKGTNGCYSKTKINIPVDSVHAEFTISDTTPAVGESVLFSALFDNAKKYTWDFDDGPLAIDQNYSHMYYTLGSYDISLTVKSDNGCEAKQTKKSAIIVNNGSGIGSKNAETLNIWPQPVGSELNFSIPGNAAATCTITDLSGKTVFSKTVTDESNTIDVSMLNQGMFILTIKTSDNVYVNQFIKE